MLDGDAFNELLNEQIEYRRYVLLRATQRRTHFMKILDEVRHYLELEQKFTSMPGDRQLLNPFETRMVHPV